MPTRRQLIVFASAAAFTPCLVRMAQASPWPDRPVHMIVPLAAGGPTDVNARIVAEQLSKIWGQQVVIDNKGGAGTNIGNAFVAHSDPDGYTLLFGTSSLAANGALYRSLDYSPVSDLAPISLVAKFPFFMFVLLPAADGERVYRLREGPTRKTCHRLSWDRERPAPC
jgi:tripartite-type tricarboxylate transporter receptor subunit TctC